MTRLPWLLAVTVLTLLSTACARDVDKVPPPATGRFAAMDRSVERIDLGTVPNLTRFGSLYFSGQPARADWAVLKQAGVVVVVNLRDESEYPGYDQVAAVKAQGFRDYIHVALRGGGWALADLERVFRAMDAAVDREQLTLVHCASSNRSGAVLWAWLVHRGYGVEEAQKLARQAGMTSEERAAWAFIQRNLQ